MFCRGRLAPSGSREGLHYCFFFSFRESCRLIPPSVECRLYLFWSTLTRQRQGVPLFGHEMPFAPGLTRKSSFGIRRYLGGVILIRRAAGVVRRESAAPVLSGGDAGVCEIRFEMGPVDLLPELNLVFAITRLFTLPPERLRRGKYIHLERSLPDQMGGIRRLPLRFFRGQERTVPLSAASG